MAETSELLKRAVVSLEKKLRESASNVVALQRELRDTQEQVVELPSVRARLVEAVAARAAAEQEAQQSARAAAAAEAATEDAQRQRERATQQAAEAEEAVARQAGVADRWRRDAEQLRVEVAQMRNEAKLLDQHVQQLEACNTGLRQENQRHARQLKDAYEREGELLAEAAQLQAQLRQLQAPRPAGRGPTCGGSSTEQAAQGPALSGIPSSAPPLSSMELMHRELFLAAAQQLTAEFSAKVEQAEQRATQLERQLAGLTVPAEQLQRQVGELRAELAAAHEQCSKGQEAVVSLVQANLRMHETVQLLADEGMGSGSGSGSGICLAQVAEEAEHCKHAEMEQQQRRLAGRRPCDERLTARSGRLSAARAASNQHLQGTRASAGPRVATGRSSGHLSGRLAETQEQLQPQMQGLQRAPAATSVLSSRQAATSDHACAPAMQQQTDARSAPGEQPAAARRAAVNAALALSAEHRALLAHQKVALAELQRTASSLATAAPPAKQLLLLRRYTQLHGEVRDCCAKLEDRAVQLAALRQAGL